MMMKRLIAALLAAALLLTACGERQDGGPGAAPGAAVEKDGVPARIFDTSGDVELTVEHPVYHPSVERFSAFITNHTDQPVSFGEAYELQRLVDGAWTDLPVREDAAWDLPLYVLEPGAAWYQGFGFRHYDFEPADGAYRLIKEVEVGESPPDGEGDRRLLCAEFQIGDSPFTAGTPYGYTALEDLPERVDLGTFVCDLATDGAGNIKKGGQGQVAEFLELTSLGAPAMLRLVTLTREGDPVLHDVIYEDGHFLYRRDNTRDRFGVYRGIHERRYGYLVTDGTYIYLSDYVSLELRDSPDRRLEADSAVILCLENFEDGAELAGQVQEATAAHLAGNSALARYWSGDGAFDASLHREPDTFGVSGRGSGGAIHQLPPEAGRDPSIYTARWLDGSRVQLLYTTGDGGVRQAVFDAETEQLTLAGAWPAQ